MIVCTLKLYQAYGAKSKKCVLCSVTLSQQRPHQWRLLLSETILRKLVADVFIFYLYINQRKMVYQQFVGNYLRGSREDR